MLLGAKATRKNKSPMKSGCFAISWRSAAALVCLALQVHTGRAAASNESSPPVSSCVRDATFATGGDAGIEVHSFRSVLENYRSYRADERLRPWREVNDEVGREEGRHGNRGNTPISNNAAPQGGRTEDMR